MALDPSGSAMAQFDQATAVAGYAGSAGVPGGPGMLPPQQQQQAGGGMDSPSILPPNFDVQVCEWYSLCLSFCVYWPCVDVFLMPSFQSSLPELHIFRGASSLLP